jgi:hypothetical protein
MQLRDGSVIEYVSREEMVQAFGDALSIIDHAGGVVSIVAGRVATGVPGEMLTQSLYIEWKDRPQATTSAEQSSSLTAPERSEARDAATLALGPDPTPEELEARLEADVMDGLDPATLDEVDESSIPEPAR